MSQRYCFIQDHFLKKIVELKMFLDKEFIIKEWKKADLDKRPFRIPYLDENWIMGEISNLEDIKQTVDKSLLEKTSSKKIDNTGKGILL